MDFETHYKNHLSKFYTWMFGDYEELVDRQTSFFENYGISAVRDSIAVDLGCGSGFQSVALRKLGFDVYAVDLSEELLSELKSHDNTIRICKGDIRELEFAKEVNPALIVCMGDTLTHLSDLKDVNKLLKDSYLALKAGGKLVLTFRNLVSVPLGTNRFFVVQSDDNQILTCFLEDEGHKVKVTDLLHRKIGGKWTLEKSSYPKLKIDPSLVIAEMNNLGFLIATDKLPSGMDVLIGSKLK